MWCVTVMHRLLSHLPIQQRLRVALHGLHPRRMRHRVPLQLAGTPQLAIFLVCFVPLPCAAVRPREAQWGQCTKPTVWHSRSKGGRWQGRKLINLHLCMEKSWIHMNTLMCQFKNSNKVFHRWSQSASVSSKIRSAWGPWQLLSTALEPSGKLRPAPVLRQA